MNVQEDLHEMEQVLGTYQVSLVKKEVEIKALSHEVDTLRGVLRAKVGPNPEHEVRKGIQLRIDGLREQLRIKQPRYYAPYNAAPDADDSATTHMAALNATENSDPVRLNGSVFIYLSYFSTVKYKDFFGYFDPENILLDNEIK